MTRGDLVLGSIAFGFYVRRAPCRVRASDDCVTVRICDSSNMVRDQGDQARVAGKHPTAILFDDLVLPYTQLSAFVVMLWLEISANTTYAVRSE